ncbi:hypothetical protein [Curtobacterium pusillum]|uniref:hypothetical protein n=1 Tax=Curtobacterium pusillum TaxID=69373 RepID=UPI00119D9857|nr:hypothetical protein [Curtobacterium pusillum]
MAWLIFVVAALIILIVTAFYLVGPFVLSSYDAKHKVQISCTVDHASSGAASARSSSGVNTLGQLPIAHPRALSSVFDFSKTNTRGLWGPQ